MIEIERFDGEKIKINKDNCFGCELIKNSYVNSGLVYESENFTISQDFELPILGMLIIASKRHVNSFTELTQVERLECMELISKTLKILKENNICQTYSIIQEEKSHFHIWLLPNHSYMLKNFGNPVKNISKIFQDSLKNLKNKETIDKIYDSLNLIKSKFNERI